MKTATMKREFEKRGIELKQDGRQHSGIYGNSEISWIDQDGYALALYVRRLNRHDDIQSDYFAGTFAHSIKYAFQLAQN